MCSIDTTGLNNKYSMIHEESVSVAYPVKYKCTILNR